MYDSAQRALLPRRSLTQRFYAWHAALGTVQAERPRVAELFAHVPLGAIHCRFERLLLGPETTPYNRFRRWIVFPQAHQPPTIDDRVIVQIEEAAAHCASLVVIGRHYVLQIAPQQEQA